MAGQDAILDTAALEREAHMGAAIVEGKDAPLIVDHEDRPMRAVHDEPPFCLQLVEGRGSRIFKVQRVHEHASRNRFWGGRWSPHPCST
jgi:hypothetical protein